MEAQTVNSTILTHEISQQQPQVVTLAKGNPRKELHERYMKKYRISLSKKDYWTFENGDKPHLAKFSAIFACPQSGEIFLSGTRGDDVVLQPVEGSDLEINWYPTKQLALDAAAARALDCWIHRNGGEHHHREMYGEDPPYEGSLTIQDVHLEHWSSPAEIAEWHQSVMKRWP